MSSRNSEFESGPLKFGSSWKGVTVSCSADEVKPDEGTMSCVIRQDLPPWVDVFQGGTRESTPVKSSADKTSSLLVSTFSGPRDRARA